MVFLVVRINIDFWFILKIYIERFLSNNESNWVYRH